MPHERVLEGVLGVVCGAEHAIAVGVQLAAQGLHEAGEGGVVSGACPRQTGLLVVLRQRLGGLRDVFAHTR